MATFPRSKPPARLRTALPVLAALGLAGCHTVDRALPTASVPTDYHARHPVVLANAPETLDVFPVGPSGRLDTRQARDIQVFAETYRRTGQGGLVLRVPSGALDAAAVGRTVGAVRRVLAANDVRDVRVAPYPAGDPSLPSPLHLSYVRLQADVASRCGDWPDDLNSGSSLNGWDNRSYYNLGCASTKTLTAQIDDPRDLLRPRAEDPTDVQLRTRAIGNLRDREDPGTKWGDTRPGSTIIPIVGVGNP